MAGKVIHISMKSVAESLWLTLWTSLGNHWVIHELYKVICMPWSHSVKAQEARYESLIYGWLVRLDGLEVE